MSRTYWLLAETENGYRVEKTGVDRAAADVAVPRDAGPSEIAAAVRQSLEEYGYRGEPTVVAVTSQACLAATIPHAGRFMVRSHQSMAYALEEFLPLAAEDMACDFVVFDNDALGVAVEASTLRPLVSALEEAGVLIASIVPTAILALQHQTKENKRPGRQVVVWQDGDAVDLFELIDGRPHIWRTFPAAMEVLAREVRLLQIISGSSNLDEMMACNVSEQLLGVLRRAAGDAVVTVESFPESAAVEAAAAILSGRQEPWIELRRGEFGEYDPYRPIRRRLRLFATAVACLLLSLSVVVWIRAEKYEQVAEKCQREQGEIFCRVFPGKPVPIGVRSRLESEYRKLAGTTGQIEGVPRLESATLLLRDALTPLPEDLRFRLLEIRLEENGLYLDGEVRQHGDADRLAISLRASGFEVDAPRTEQLAEKGVSVVIAASRPSGEVGTHEKGGGG